MTCGSVETGTGSFSPALSRNIRDTPNNFWRYRRLLIEGDWDGLNAVLSAKRDLMTTDAANRDKADLQGMVGLALGTAVLIIAVPGIRIH